MQLRADAGECCEVNNRAPSCTLPYAGPHINVSPVGFFRHEVDRRNSDCFQYVVDNTDGRRQEQNDHTTHNYGGNEVRRVGDGLDHFPVSLMAEGVQHQCQDDRNRE